MRYVSLPQPPVSPPPQLLLGRLIEQLLSCHVPGEMWPPRAAPEPGTSGQVMGSEILPARCCGWLLGSGLRPRGLCTRVRVTFESRKAAVGPGIRGSTLGPASPRAGTCCNSEGSRGAGRGFPLSAAAEWCPGRRLQPHLARVRASSLAAAATGPGILLSFCGWEPGVHHLCPHCTCLVVPRWGLCDRGCPRTLGRPYLQIQPTEDQTLGDRIFPGSCRKENYLHSVHVVFTVYGRTC